ncbi:hypothetical protein [Rhizorhabdus wittichii]|uniref:hypothetical protein n=1 Tax=Rhizorhabdus wittichii TaxID=160791 RepID=UPI00178C2292|nr:hypothetical protein [Rhizorhabdus wittichii]
MPELPPLAQQREDIGREHRVATLSALAAFDAEQHPFAVDIGDLEHRQLGGVEPGAIGDRERRLMLRQVVAVSSRAKQMP